jgi:hypothetical protein
MAIDLEMPAPDLAKIAPASASDRMAADLASMPAAERLQILTSLAGLLPLPEMTLALLQSLSTADQVDVAHRAGFRPVEADQRPERDLRRRQQRLRLSAPESELRLMAKLAASKPPLAKG